MMKAANEPEIGETLKQSEILPPLSTTLENFQHFEKQLNEINDMSTALSTYNHNIYLHSEVFRIRFVFKIDLHVILLRIKYFFLI